MKVRRSETDVLPLSHPTNCDLVVYAQMDQSGLSLGSTVMYTGNSSVHTHKAFVDYFNAVTRLLGANQTTSAYADDVWLLEKAIAEVMSLRILF